MISCLRVKGISMYPFLFEGDYVVISRISKLRADDVVVIKHKIFGKIIKRVKEISHDNRLILKSDYSKGISSEKIGPITKEDILGKVLFRIKVNH